jgi:hypothetical protein
MTPARASCAVLGVPVGVGVRVWRGSVLGVPLVALCTGVGVGRDPPGMVGRGEGGPPGGGLAIQTFFIFWIKVYSIVRMAIGCCETEKFHCPLNIVSTYNTLSR